MLASIEAIGVGGADMPEAFRRLYEERFGRRVGTGYGLTEAPTSVTGEDVTGPPVPGTCGRALPQVRIHILDDDGVELPPARLGEVCVGPSEEGDFRDTYRPMLGYWNRPDGDRRSPPRWPAAHGRPRRARRRREPVHQGPPQRPDHPGWRQRLPGRGGAGPARRAGVAACAVIGEPDERLGERVVAFVERRRRRRIVDEASLARALPGEPGPLQGARDDHLRVRLRPHADGQDPQDRAPRAGAARVVVSRARSRVRPGLSWATAQAGRDRAVFSAGTTGGALFQSATPSWTCAAG